MADQRYDSSQKKKSRRTNGPGNVGRARARQNQRTRAKELRQSLTQSVSPSGLRSTLERASLSRAQTPSLKDVQDKLAGVKSGELLNKRASQSGSREEVPPTRSGERTSPRVPPTKSARRSSPSKQVMNMPQRNQDAGRSRLLSDNRLYRDRRAPVKQQSKMPPVLVRGGMPDMTVRRSRQSLPKRRYDVALNVPGAELRLPSLPMVQIGWRIVSGILALMMIACLFLMWKSPAFQVNAVEAEGLQRLTIGELNTIMDILDTSIFSIDPPAVEGALRQAFPELADISVTAGLPARVVIHAVERQPVLAWFQDNREVWVDEEGVAFLPRGNPGPLVRVEGHGIAPEAITSVYIPDAGALPPGVTVARAAAADDSASEEEMVVMQPARLPEDLIQAILTLGSQVPEDTQLVYDSQYGLGWDDPLGWEVFFGIQTNDMDQKLVVYQGVVDYLTRRGLQPELVSVAFVHAPYYRMER